MWSKYRVQKKQVYQNGGWVDTDPLQTRTGEKIGEYDSFSGCSGYDILYRWQPANPNEDWVCSGYTKYYKEYYQVSYDNGSTWVNVVPEQTRTGDFIEDYSWDCGYTAATKWKATYSSGTTADGCDSSSAITQNEISVDGLLSVTIGDCVTELSYMALDSWSHNSVLTSVTFGQNVDTIGQRAFGYCSGLTSVNIPNSVTSIGKSAFVNCSSLTSVTIPNSVTLIDNGCFLYCSGLTSVIIPSSITKINNTVFDNCYSLSSITIPNSVTSIGNSSFANCRSLTSITIPNSVVSIGNSVFSNCYNLTSITIPNSVETISGYAFSSCYRLASLTIGNSVASIGEYAFTQCNGLTSVTIPDNVTFLGDNVFRACTGLTSIICLATTPPTLQSNQQPGHEGEYWNFYDTNNCPIMVPSASLSLYQNATGWSTYSSRIVAIT